MPFSQCVRMKAKRLLGMLGEGLGLRKPVCGRSMAHPPEAENFNAPENGSFCITIEPSKSLVNIHIPVVEVSLCTNFWK